MSDTLNHGKMSKKQDENTKSEEIQATMTEIEAALKGILGIGQKLDPRP